MWMNRLLVSLLVASFAACSGEQPVDRRFTAVSGADNERGQQLLAQYQCGSCHEIPDVPAAAGVMGPPLAAFGRRSYIAGEVPSGPANLMRWIQAPQALVPGTVMPNLGVPPDDARDMAAYLLALR
jgi:cytochrome c